MLIRQFLLTLAMMGVASIAYAQSTGMPAGPSRAPESTTHQTMTHREINQAMAPIGGQRYKVAITDEYGFHYDSRGDRLNAAGHVIAPPDTLPGARVLP